MATVRDVMRDQVEYLQTSHTAADAASFLACHGVGSVTLCDADGHLAGIVTERDIVVKVVALGEDPRAFALSDLAGQCEAFSVGLDDAVEDAVAMMAAHQVAHIPVVEDDKVVGLVERGAVARSLMLGHSWADL
jgi:CBS domain-containing protein